MPFTHEGKIVIAVTSRALFNMDEEHAVFEEDVDKFIALQQERYDVPPPPGAAFSLVKKLLSINSEAERLVEVVIVSRNDPVSGLRAFQSCSNYGLDITRGVFTGGRDPYEYLKPFKSTLFLSANDEDVRGALAAGHAAARVYPRLDAHAEAPEHELRIAFDGDAVLFGAESEEIFQSEGLEKFHDNEWNNRDVPMTDGPMRPLLVMLKRLQRQDGQDLALNIRIALVTARNAPSHERAIRPLMSWGIEVDEAMFLGGLTKADFLEVFKPDLFFDDQTAHCEPASQVVGTALVPFGPFGQRVSTQKAG